MTIDLRSDTVTVPCEQMKKAMFNATVGDAVFGDRGVKSIVKYKNSFINSNFVK